MPKKSPLIIFLIVILLLIQTLYASADPAPTPDTPHKWFRSFGFTTGYGAASFDKKDDDYEVLPLLFQFGLDICPMLVWHLPIGVLTFILE